jgi:hypothetical protein
VKGNYCCIANWMIGKRKGKMEEGAIPEVRHSKINK